MPEQEIAPVTQLAKELSAKTAAAVKDTGFDKAFDIEVDAALKKDAEASAKKPDVAPAKPAETKPVEAAKPAPVKEAVLDIPEDVFKKEPAAEKPSTTDEEREKFVKEQTKDLSPKAADRFRALEKAKHEAEQRAVRATELEKQLAEANERIKKATDSSEAESLRKRLEEMDAIVKKQALADHPQFKAHYDEKIEREIGIAKKMAGDANASEVEALLRLPVSRERNKRLSEIAEGLETLESSSFLRAIDESDRFVSERTNELNNWKVNARRMEELAQKEQIITEEHRTKAVESALRTVIPRFTDPATGIELFKKVDGNEAWNAGVDERLSKVRQVASAQLGIQDIAEMAAWAMSGPEYRKWFLTQRVLVKKLQDEVASLRGGEPDLGQGGADTGGGEDVGGGGMVDAVARMAAKEGAVR